MWRGRSYQDRKPRCRDNTTVMPWCRHTKMVVIKEHFPGKLLSQSMATLTHWGRVTHICVSKLAIIGSDNGLSPGRRKAIIWTNDGILLIRTFRTHFSEIVSEIHTFSFKKMHLKMSSGKWRPSCLGLNVLMLGIYWCQSAWKSWISFSSNIFD